MNSLVTSVSVEEGGGKLASFQLAPRLLWEISVDHSITFGIRGWFYTQGHLGGLIAMLEQYLRTLVGLCQVGGRRYCGSLSLCPCV